MLAESEERLLSHPDTGKGKLQRIALLYLREKKAKGEIPTSVRFLFYELEQRGIVSKKTGASAKPRLNRHGNEMKKRPPAQNLGEAVMHLRKVGLIPWNWIEDETRALFAWRSAASVADFVVEVVPVARLDPWAGTSRPVIICESRSMGGILRDGVAGRYLVTVAPTSGQCGGFLVTDVAPHLRDDDTRVLYLGDFDLAGGQIEANTRDVLERHTGRTFDGETWERVALTAEQVEGLRLRGVEPILKKDDRYIDQHPHEAFECEALGQGPIVAALRDRLDELLPEPIEDVLEREAEEKQKVRRVLARSFGRRS